ncbi:Aste57867_16089 [Aphanomyces stellatus]|uniref:Aste57867_16089 protein n=1 Tax=Aphanomyces stellatus TaxID=120398 RepID=A0A485L4Y5_9STRA|nr:hypothetical protein As57867_016033 [Aphanomyces stellatus]VFT92872.1 Aste57867_16089 [Aphanomyces stellatus]
MRVLHHDEARVPSSSYKVASFSRRNVVVALLGCGYLGATTASSMWYLSTLNPSFANDLWWVNYTVRGHQALVVDVFNSILTTQSTCAIDVLAPRWTMAKTYDDREPTIDIYPTYPRRLVLNELTTVEFAVANLRVTSAYWSLYMSSQYCWVDFNHEFEIAHTVARQQRCVDRYRGNGAVYMETVLRAQKWHAFMQTYGGDGGVFTTAIQAWLEQVPRGQEWLATTSTARQTTSLAQEAAYWRAANISYFQLQWQNNMQSGVSEAMSLENALGLRYDVAVKTMPPMQASWTSVVMNWNLVNDLFMMQMVDCSLVRSANNSFVHMLSYTVEDMLGLQDSNGDYVDQIQTFRTTVGPFVSVDLFYVAVPAPLLRMYEAFQTALHMLLATQVAVQSTLDAMVAVVTLQPTPPSWVTTPKLVYYGGNPMCLYGGPLPYVQDTFGFADTCNSQLPLTATVNPYAMAFATTVLATRLDIATSCSLDTVPSTCHAYVQAIAKMIAGLDVLEVAPWTQPSIAAVTQLQLGLMQFASAPDGTNWTLLTQPLLDDSAWDMYGWVLLYDWVEGSREVVSFEGDLTSLVLISAASRAVPFPANAATITSATRVLYYLVVYMSAVLSVLAVMCVIGVCRLRFQTHGVNLVWFNRIVGSIWHDATRFDRVGSWPQPPSVSPRPVLTTMVLAGEATWVLYVAEDFLTVVFQRFTSEYGPVSCLVAWVTLLGLEVGAPILPTASLERHCTSKNMDIETQCASGVLQIGSVQRLTLLLTVFGLSMVGAAGVVGLYRTGRGSSQKCRAFTRHLLGVADVFLASDDGGVVARPSHWALDKVSCFMAGLVPMTWQGQQYTFDIKLWVLHQDHLASDRTTKSFSFHVRQLDSRVTSLRPAAEDAPPAHSRMLAVATKSLGTLLGIVYAVGSIIGSVSYLQVSQLNLANDLFWATFNTTGCHSFLATWLNVQLLLGVTNATVQLHTDIVNLDLSYASTTGLIKSGSNVGATLQYAELNAIEDAIIGLRQTDGCAAPWIFTQYCFVDFSQRWEMANSAARQLRCQHMTANGAVFLESVLRNIPFGDFDRCWGVAFDVAIASALKQSTAGLSWLTTISVDMHPSVGDEIALWTSHRITRFETQWQNFKRIGVVNHYSVENAFGTAYPLLLQSQSPSFRLASQTSFKLYWGLANDFLAVAGSNSSGGGRSLVRSSADFAFANTTILAAFVRNGTLMSPLANIFVVMTAAVGPYGSVDMRFVACPVEAKVAVRGARNALRSALAHSMAAQVAYYHIYNPVSNVVPVPHAWTRLDFISVGGTPLCPEVPLTTGHPISSGLQRLMSWESQCVSTPLVSLIDVTVEAMVIAAVMANMVDATPQDMARTCAQNPLYVDACTTFLNQTIGFVQTYMRGPLREQLPSPAIAVVVRNATSAIQALNVQFVQFGHLDGTAPLQLFRLNVLDPSEYGFTYFAWLFLHDWAFGSREAVALEGDNGSLTVLTEYLTPVELQVNPAEAPTVMAYYLRNTVLYITVAMIVLASVMLVYMVLSRGYIEVLNLFELQRVGAFVWCGRPLLLVRSLTAVALLSTSTLQLVFNGILSYFQVTPTPWYTTLLAANEVTWMVAIVNDIAMAVTRDYTPYYARLNSVLVWVITASLSLAKPLSHSLTIDKQCHVIQVDFHIECTTGMLTMGRVTRLAAILVVIASCNALCYVVTRAYLHQLPPTKVDSLFVYAGARYLFTTATWVYDDVYYMDRMSAVLNGILTLRWRNTIHGLDVKLWRAFHVDVPTNWDIPATQDLAASATYALPLSLAHR